MKFNKLIKDLAILPQRIILKMFFGVKRRQQFLNVNINKGINTFIDPSAILITGKNGELDLKGNNYIGRNVELGTEGKIEIGYGTSIQDRCIIVGDIEIGKYCLLSLNVHLSSGKHNYNFKPEYYIRDQDKLVSLNKEAFVDYSKKVVIEDDCWLGINSVVMQGITIGRGSVIGANSVITKNVEPFSIMVGAPARLIKKRLDFLPKSKLNFNNDADLPNFYKGFFVDLENLQLGRQLEGIAASNEFVCYLDTENKTKLTICLKKIVLGKINLAYNNQKQLIQDDSFTEFTFDIDKNNFHKFVIGIANENSCFKAVLIKYIITY